MKLPWPPLLLITDRRQARYPLEQVVAAAIEGGCRWVSLREKDLPADERRALLGRLVAIGRPRGVTVTVHEDIEAAAAEGAAGIHLPANGSPQETAQRLGREALIGISCHTVAEIAAAAKAGAHYATLSPIFLSSSKPGYGPALGTEALRRAADHGVPVVALAGIDADNVRSCMIAGAAGAAVMGGIMTAPDAAEATANLIAALRV